MKPFLLLSKQSPALIAHCLQSSETTAPNAPPKLCINRHRAREHRANPALDPSCRNTVFTQVRPHRAPRRVLAKPASLAPRCVLSLFCSAPFQLYEGLRSSKNNQLLDYR